MKTNQFQNDWEFQLGMRPIADRIYRMVWGDAIHISRGGDSEYPHIDLDRLLAVDVRIVRANGLTMTGQEKFRRPQDKIYYGDRTVEYMNNPTTSGQGDWFHFGGQWYFCGIATLDHRNFRPWVLVDWRSLQELTERGYIKWTPPRPNEKHGKSNFVCTKMRKIPPEAVIKSSYQYHINLGPLFNGYKGGTKRLTNE